jgi:hypothetical protein
MAKVVLKINKSDPPAKVVLPGSEDMPLYMPKDTVKHIRINDARKESPTTGLPLKDTDRKSMNVDPELIKDIVTHAKKSGIDPLTALAISYQETGFNQEGKGAFNLNPNVFGKPVGNAEEGMRSLQEQFKYANNLQARGVIPQGEDYFLQGNNGYGLVKRGHADLEGAHKIYGMDIPHEGLNLGKNPLYGKTVLSLRELLKSNPEIMQLVNTDTTSNPNKVILKTKR